MQEWLKPRRHSQQYDSKDKPKYSLLDEVMDQGCNQRLPFSVNIVVGLLLVGIIITALNVYELHQMQKEHYIHLTTPVAKQTEVSKCTKPTLWVKGKNIESGYLSHVFAVFERIGFQIGDKNSNWDVLWDHDYPFVELSMEMQRLKPHQKVNHFPGSGYITNKVSLATSNMKYIPPAFQIPADKSKLIEYAKHNPKKLWVQKSNNHRGIMVQKIGDLDLDTEGTFVQEFISNPLLINGRKFDIGVYAMLTSVNPLRAYIYNGDVLLRFCSKDYYPFDPTDLESYVVGDNYTPTWKIPSLQTFYSTLGYSMKESLNAYLRKQGKDVQKLWSEIEKAIRTVYLEKETLLIAANAKYKSPKNFFELVRFDFVLDEDLNVFLMEANMSPNLSSLHFAKNKLLYEQVIYNLLTLAGLTRFVNPIYLPSSYLDEKDMQVSSADIYVFSNACESSLCQKSCISYTCRLCKRCLSYEEEQMLKDAYLEFVNKKNSKKIIPAPTTQEAARKYTELDFEHLSDQNHLLARWFQGRCLEDKSWCS